MLGGSYNPVHIGHLLLVEAVLDTFHYDKALLVPAFNPPHKALSEGASNKERLGLLALAIAGNDRCLVEPCELEREGISYSIDTIRYITKKYKLQEKPGLILGDDLLEGYPLWKECDALAQEADLIVARRNFSEIQEFKYAHKVLENPLFPVSSSMVRDYIKSKKSFRYLVGEAVYSYIRNHKLYGFTEDN